MADAVKLSELLPQLAALLADLPDAAVYFRVDCYGDCNYEAPVVTLVVDPDGDVVLHDGTWEGASRRPVLASNSR